MKILLATGIYPPDIGGPATYVRALARALKNHGQEIIIVSYGSEPSVSVDDGIAVVRVGKRWPIVRWWRYARALRAHAGDADIVYAFSSISVGVPLVVSRLTCPQRILRLGGDFFWERYTDGGGRMGLTQWYASGRSFLARRIMGALLRAFDHIVFSTSFQRDIYRRYYSALPDHSVIENALPQHTPARHQLHQPVRLLSLGRFVGFKNLASLVRAMAGLADVTLTFVGSGPMKDALMQLAQSSGVAARVRFLPPARDEAKWRTFDEHDILVIPSVTEISPNTALEARAAGLPVLMSRETGLSAALTDGMTLAFLEKPDDIIAAIRTMIADYDRCSALAAQSLFARDWDTVGREHLSLFGDILESHRPHA